MGWEIDPAWQPIMGRLGHLHGCTRTGQEEMKDIISNLPMWNLNEVEGWPGRLFWAWLQIVETILPWGGNCYMSVRWGRCCRKWRLQNAQNGRQCWSWLQLQELLDPMKVPGFSARDFHWHARVQLSVNRWLAPKHCLVMGVSLIFKWFWLPKVYELQASSCQCVTEFILKDVKPSSFYVYIDTVSIHWVQISMHLTQSVQILFSNTGDFQRFLSHYYNYNIQKMIRPENKLKYRKDYKHNIQ